MRRESDNNLSSNSSNTPHGNFPSGDNNLSHLNYHPIHGYGGASNYSGYQSSKIRSEQEKKKSYRLRFWGGSALKFIFTSPSRHTLTICISYIIFSSLTLFDFKGNRPNSALISAAAAASSSAASSSQNQLEEYVDILQVQQLLLENSTASSSSSSTVNTASYTSPASSATTSSAIASKNLQSRPRVNLQKAAEFAQVQGKILGKLN